jgi:hypothetical protein
MEIERLQTSMPALGSAVRRGGWIAALSIAAVAGSLIFACATPFVALATFAALYMQRRDAFMVTGVTWLANQAVGFGFMHYPHTLTTAAWGIAIGVSTVIATALAAGINRVLRPFGWLATVPAVFAAAFAGYEIALRTATVVLPSNSGAFSVPVVLYILKVNAVALGGLFVLKYAAARLGLALPRLSTAAAPTMA